MKNLTYDELIKIAPKDRPFKIEVESNPYGKGGKQVLWARINIDGDLATTGLGQVDIDGIDYAWDTYWRTHYEGKFTFIDPRYQKPEVLKVGQKVRIMESLRDHGNFEKTTKEYKNSIGGIYPITIVGDDARGVYYVMDSEYIYPHYAVMPVEEEEEEIQEIPELKGMIEEFEGLMVKAQEIVDKYKK